MAGVSTKIWVKPREVDRLDLESLERGRTHRLRVEIVEDPLAGAIRVPVLVVRGVEPGPVVGITAALHGNELNGIPTIHRLLRTIDARDLRGDIVAVPVVNVPGFFANRREYLDGQDLNRIMPGKPDGNCGQVYAWRFLQKVVRPFGYLFDLHTASFGRINSLYIRADLTDPTVATMARLVGAQIIVHNEGADGTLRGAAAEMGVHAITIEVGDPQRFQENLITSSRIGIRDFIEHLEMVAADHESAPRDAVECSRSFWLYTDRGGILHVLPDVAERVRRGQVIAHLTDEWGHVLRQYEAPEDAIVIGRSTNPVANTGARIAHLGLVGPPAR